MRIARFIVVAALSVAVFAVPVQSQINYGDFSGDDIDFLSVTEVALSAGDSEPLFGAPIVAGNTLLFNSMSFASNSTGEFGIDDTIGQLTTTITADPLIGITGLEFDEVGSVSLTGLSNDAFASVGAVYVINILEVNGMSINPINRTFNMAFNPSDGDYLLSVDGILSAEIWEGSLDIDMTSILADEDVEGVATAVSLTLTNSLSTLSQAGTSAFIGKKQQGGLAVTVIIPSPAGLGLLAVAGFLGGRRRRRS